MVPEVKHLIVTRSQRDMIRSREQQLVPGYTAIGLSKLQFIQKIAQDLHPHSGLEIPMK